MTERRRQLEQEFEEATKKGKLLEAQYIIEEYASELTRELSTVINPMSLFSVPFLVSIFKIYINELEDRFPEAKCAADSLKLDYIAIMQKVTRDE